MIKIENPNIDKIASNYYDEIKDIIQDRCHYLLEVFEVLFNHSPNINLKNHYLHGTTKKSLTNQFLFQNNLKNQNQYNNVTQLNCHPWVLANQNILVDITKYLFDDKHLRELILVSPDDAGILENNIKATIGLTPVTLTSNIKEFINSIIDYSFFENHAYSIALKLNINTCPYCNRNYINTVIDKKGKKIIRPTFDHFFPQKAHPFLALSFYNLIPSCYFCNSSIKGAANINILTHINPYKEGFDKDATFHVMIKNCKPKKSDPENYTLIFMDNINPLVLGSHSRYKKIFGGSKMIPNKDEGNINLFKLEDIYQSHLDIVGELVVKCDRLSLGYSDSLHGLFGLLKTNKIEFYQYYFGNYFNEKDFHRRPMAKMSKDVVSQLIPWFI